MRKFTAVLLLVIISAFGFAQFVSPEMEFAQQKLNERGEFYFSFNSENKDLVREMSRQLSIDKVQGNTVYAYANTQEFNIFLSYNLNFEPVYEYYNAPKVINMATTTAQMATWDRYPTHAVYLQMLDNFVANYPTLCKLETIGTSVDGYPIKCLIISDNINSHEDEPEFWWSGTMHGDETTGWVLLLRMADYLLSNYGTNSQVTNLVNNMEIYINPLANPDGTFNGSATGTSILSATRSNANNIDLNRNFPTLNGTSYTLQPEIQCMMDYSATHDFVMGANTHGGIELLNFPWDTWQSWENPNVDQNWWEHVCFVYADEVEIDAPATYFEGPGTMDYPSGYNNTTGVTHGADWYYAIGSRQDYMNYYRNYREVTLELSNTKMLGTENLNTYWGYNRDGMLLYMEQCLYGFRGIVTDACTGSALSDVRVEIVGHDQDNTHVFSSAPVGNYHRPIYAGTYNVTFSKTGYASKTLPVTVINNQSTRLDVQLIPDGTAVPNFSASSTSIVEGQTVNFTDATSGSVSSRSWSFEGGSPATSTSVNPTNILYSTAGTYDVTLTVISNGCTVSETKTDYITVNPAIPPVANFSASATNVAQGTTVVFTDLSTNGPTSWAWVFDGGTPASSTTQNPSIVYNTPGTYTVSLTATNAYGSDDEVKTAYITVTEADLLMSNGTSTRCSGLFKDSGGDAAYANNLTYTHTIYPSTSGAYVKLTFTSLDLEPNGASCYDYITIYDGESTAATEIGTYCGTDHTVIGTSGVVTSTDASGALTILFSSDNGVTAAGWVASISCYSPTDPPVADFSSNVTSSCTGEIQFNDESLLATSWLWNFGDGQTSTEQNPLHTYTADGTYTVSLYVENAYGNDTHSVTDMIIVDMPDAPSTTGATACGPASLTLSASGAGTLNWFDAAIDGTLVNTGTSFTNNFTSTTTYYVQSEIDNNISSNVGPVDHTIGTAAALNSTTAHGLYFNAESDFRLVSVVVYSSTTGSKTINLKDSGGNIIQTANVTISEINTATTAILNFDIPQGSGYQLAGTANNRLFRNTTGGSYPYEIENIVSIYDNTAADLNYYYFFYNWVVEYNIPCVSSRTPVTATINPIPTDVIVTGGGTQCGGTATLNATGGTGGTIYWQNTTNNGTSTDVASVSQTVSSNGTYYFRAQSAEGCWGNQGSASVTINPVPTAVTVSGGVTQCGGSTTLTATGGTGGTIYWQGTTSGGTSTTTASSSQTVSASGTYYFRSRSAEGCWGAEGSATVTINPLPGDVTVSGGGVQCGGTRTLTATGGTGGTIYWQNTTNNGISTTTASSSQAVSSSGTYYFRARTTEGCWGNQGSATVTINPAVSVSVSTTPESAPGANDGTATAVISAGTAPYSITWQPSYIGNPITALTGGNYCVTVQDFYNCTATACGTVSTNGAAPVADFSVDVTEGCDNLTVSFTDESANFPTSWAWDFGDGTSTSSVANPIHTYNTPGIYTVSLTVTNATGSDDLILTNYIYVGETPDISLSMTQATYGNNDGTALVSATGGTMPYSFDWSGPSGFVSTQASLTNLEPGEYCVTVTSMTGCEVTDCITVTSESAPAPVAAFSADVTEGCDNLTVSFTDLSTNNPTSWAWDFGDGSSTSSVANPIHTYNAPGIYTVSLTVTNATGSDDLILTNYIYVSETPTLELSMTQETLAGNDGSATVVATGGSMPYIIEWNNGFNNFTINGLTAGEFCVTVTETGNDCQASACIDVTQEVLPAPVADFEADDTEACLSLTVNFTDLSTNNPTEWLWDFGDGATSTEQNPTHAYSTIGVYTVSLTSTNAIGSDQELKTDYISVFAKPTLAFDVTNESATSMNDGSIELTITGGAEPYTINWSNGLHTTLISDLTAGVYSVAVIDDNGCMSTGSAEVQVASQILQNLKSEIIIYPNPSDGVFTIEANESITSIQIIDATGRICNEFSASGAKVNISANLVSGVYFIKVNTIENSGLFKMIVQ